MDRSFDLRALQEQGECRSEVGRELCGVAEHRDVLLALLQVLVSEASDEGIDATEFAVPVDERTSAVAVVSEALLEVAEHRQDLVAWMLNGRFRSKQRRHPVLVSVLERGDHQLMPCRERFFDGCDADVRTRRHALERNRGDALGGEQRIRAHHNCLVDRGVGRGWCSGEH
ncbi:hypothetical protein [Curtobacterium sp. SL109]|uniref:hypothetical protein n=1 Tax=Curtobacterium sp. SL109 TaxID=2994662 RepID=UPI00227619E0|nr:hypothetical protein [Curtobacterium sp. SL109]MCY1692959.1 hypothetical protein [Curtobacterium sp. SL109]